MERFNWALSDLPNWGTSLINIGGLMYMKTDDDNLLVSEMNRVFGSELECFGNCEGGG
ncbi:MAG: hypothetical protein OHK0053_34080 [Microscillaceae bacterium]